MKIPVLAVLLLAVAKAASHCSESPKKLVCEDVYLETDKPILFNTSLAKLDIVRANGSIGHKTFSSVPQLEELSIVNSHINHVEDGVLCSIPNLYKLSLQLIDNFPILAEALLSNCHNIANLSLSYLQLEPKAFKHMANIKYLTLINVNISHLTVDYMEPLKNLEDIYYLKSNIGTIDPGVLCLPPKLESLRINRVTTNLPSLTKSLFENCSRIKTFMFEYNTHITIDEDAINGMTSAKWLILDHVNIGHLKRSFLQGLHNLELLGLSTAGIVKIDPDSFIGLDRVSILSLSSNKLSEADYPSMVRALPNLFALHLENITLTTIDNINHPKLNILRIRGNIISKIDAKAVKENFPQLEKLYANCNNMSSDEEQALKSELRGITVITTDDMPESTCAEVEF